MNRKTTAWTHCADQLLRDLWMAHSAVDIARTISASSHRTINRKAVIGRAYRLGLPRKKASTKTARVPPIKPTPMPKNMRRSSFRAHPPTDPIASREFEKVTPTRTLETLDPRECRFPIGDVGDPEFGFCGRSAQGSYCPLHRSIVYLPVSRRPRPLTSEIRRDASERSHEPV